MPVLEAGRHDVHVVRTWLVEDTGGKAPAVAVQFEDADGDTITAYLHLTDAAWPYSKEKLATLGWDADREDYKFELLDAEPSPLAGSAVEIVVKNETYNDKTGPRVAFINPPGGRIERLEPLAAQAFAARMRAKLRGGASVPVKTRQMPLKAKATNQGGGGPVQGADTDDDIPFISDAMRWMHGAQKTVL